MESALTPAIDEALEAASDLQSLLDARGEELADKLPATTAAQRKAATLEAIASTDIDRLLELDDKFRAAIDIITANTIDLENLGRLSPAQLASLMREHLDEKDLKEVLEVRYKMIREALFAHFDVIGKNVAAVPEEHMRFERRGGRAKAALDHTALAEKLGEQRTKTLYRTTVIPEQVVTQFDEDALFQMVQEDPAVLEIVRECVIPAGGGYTQASFHVKALK